MMDAMVGIMLVLKMLVMAIILNLEISMRVIILLVTDMFLIKGIILLVVFGLELIQLRQQPQK